MACDKIRAGITSEVSIQSEPQATRACFIKGVNILFYCPKASNEVSIFSHGRKQTRGIQRIHKVKITLRLLSGSELPCMQPLSNWNLSFSAIETLNSSDSESCAGMTKPNQTGLFGSLEQTLKPGPSL